MIVGQATAGMDSLITQEQLDNYQARDLGDIFRTDASITAAGPVGMGQKIYLRNIGEDLLNISVDGAEQAGSVFHHAGRITIEPELLKQVEVEAGAGSAAAGLGALGGSVRFVTKDPDDLLKPGQHLGAMLKTSYSDNASGFKNTATLFGQTEGGQLGGILSLTDSDSDGLSDGEGNALAGTRSDRELGFVKLTGQLTSSQSFSLSHEMLKDEGATPYRSEWKVGPGNPEVPSTGKRKTSILNYDLHPAGHEWLDLSLNLYNTRHEQTRDRWDADNYGHSESKGLTLQNVSRINAHDLVYGINYRDDESYLEEGAKQEEGTIKALFVQDIVQVSNRLTLAAGLRFDDYDLKDVNGLELSDSGFSPNISANYELSPGLSISAGYAEAFRGPEVKDAYKLWSAYNDPELEAETSRNLEFGIDLKRGAFDIGAGVYRSVIENPIGGTTPWDKTSTNLSDDIETLGFFLKFGYSKGAWDLLASLNVADTTLDDDKVIRYVYGSGATSIGDTLALDLNYQVTPALKLGWNAEFVRGLGDFDVTVGGQELAVNKPGYAVHDLYAHWLPTGSEDVVLGLSVNNLFDKQYLSHASVENLTNNAGYEMISGLAEAGRDVRLSATFWF